jgi:hypothetical protein
MAIPPDIIFSDQSTGSGVDVSTPTVTSVQKAIRVQRSILQSQLRMNAELSLRADISQTIRDAQKTATITSKPILDQKVRLEQNTQQQTRLNPTNESTGFGLVVGKLRTDVEDTSNLLQRQTIQSISIDVNRTILQSNVVSNIKRDKIDVNRARTKLQRKCNHRFVLATELCQYCSKNRSFHI